LLVFLTGVFLGAFEPLPEKPRPIRRLAKGFGVLACLYGALLLIGSTLGGEDPLRPLPNASGSFAGAPREDQGPDFIQVETVTELESLLADARSAGQPVMIDFTAWWCASCLEMEEYTFPDPAVLTALAPFMVLQADVADNTDDDKALLAYFESFGPPTIAFFDRYGRNLDAAGYTLVGFEKAGAFAARVNEVAAL
jgi:thiol:disulfide interchange protein DsbD